MSPLLDKQGVPIHARAPKLRCDRCGTRLADPSRRVFSKHTGAHYCVDVKGCARRAARKAKS